jgi:hypothetical protein
VRHAIDDIQGSIHANDSKSAAGLVVHALLATAVVTLATRAGSSYREGTSAAQIVVKVGLASTLAIAVASIVCLVIAIRPYEPKRLAGWLEGRYEGIFFPDFRALRKAAKTKGEHPLDELRRKFRALSNPAVLDDEYLAELLKVADIRATEADWAKRGFTLLAVEVIFVAIYLGAMGAIAGNMLDARASKAATSLAWTIAQDGRHSTAPGVANIRLHRVGVVDVGLIVASPSGVRHLRLTDTVRYECAARRGVRRRVDTVAASQDLQAFGAKKLQLQASRHGLARRCTGRRRGLAGVRLTVLGDVRSETGALDTADLTIHAP